MTFHCPDWPPKAPEIRSQLERLIESGDWGCYQAANHGKLREIISDRFSQTHVRLCGSGSAAVEMALRAAGIRPEDRVILCAYDYPGNFRAIEIAGGKPLLVDSQAGRPTIDLDQIKQIASEPTLCQKVSAVLVSHLYGVAAPIAEIAAICKSHEWTLIEDACQVPGMMIDESPAGSFGDLATLSFGGSKPLTAGNGGAVLTSENRFSARINAYLDRPSDSHPLSALQATALLPQMDLLDKHNTARRATAQHLESNVNPSLDSWQWLSASDSSVLSAHYKVAWSCSSSEKRKRIITKAQQLGLPMGSGFRAMSRSSERRCDKPFPLENAARLGETVIVLDHSALLTPQDCWSDLATAIIEANLLA